MSRALDWKPSARRDLKRLAPEIRTRVVEAMKHHAATGQGTVRKLIDVSPPEYRLRVGDWRIRFAVVSLGIEALERFVRREPLRRVHECVFGALALESEPVDPRL